MRLFVSTQLVVAGLRSIGRSVLVAALIGVLVASAAVIEYQLFHVYPPGDLLLAIWPASILFIAAVGASKAQVLVLSAELAAINGIYYGVLGLVAHGAIHLHRLVRHQRETVVTVRQLVVSVAACVAIFGACLLATVFRS
jgi:hypothetical protein